MDGPTTFVACVGVAIAGIGLWITVPQGFRELQKQARDQRQAVVDRARQLLARLPWWDMPESYDVQPKDSSHGHVSEVVRVTTSKADANIWRSGTSAHERVERLHQMHIALISRVNELERDLREETAAAVGRERKARQEAVAEVELQVGEISRYVRAAQEGQVHVDALGIPVVFVGILFTGVPQVIALGGWASAAVVSGTGILFTSWRASKRNGEDGPETPGGV